MGPNFLALFNTIPRIQILIHYWGSINAEFNFRLELPQLNFFYNTRNQKYFH